MNLKNSKKVIKGRSISTGINRFENMNIQIYQMSIKRLKI